MLSVITGEEKAYDDSEGVAILENFFTGLGKSLNVFVERLTKDAREQRLLVIQNLQPMMEKYVEEIISSTGLDSLRKEDFQQ